MSVVAATLALGAPTLAMTLTLSTLATRGEASSDGISTKFDVIKLTVVPSLELIEFTVVPALGGGESFGLLTSFSSEGDA
jgi:hypothetical protein